MYIELLGLPGSGKTTLCDGILQRNKSFKHIDDAFICYLNDKYNLSDIILRDGGQSSWYRAYEKFYAKIGYHFDKNNKNYANKIDHIMTDAGLTSEQKSSYLEYSVIDNKKYNATKVHNCEKLIIHDEGFSLRFLIMFADLEAGNGYDASYIKESPQPEILVHISTDIDKCISRMQNRERGLPKIFSGMDENRIKNQLEKFKFKINDVVSEYERQGTKVIDVDNNKNKRDTIQELAVKLKKHA